MRIKTISIVILLTISTLHIVFAKIDSESSEWENYFTGPNTFWGAETNGLIVGLYVEPLVSSNNMSISCTPLFKSNVTNTPWIYIAPIESRFQMFLFNDKGNPVAKTTKGIKLGSPLTKPVKLKNGINFKAGFVGIPPIRKDHTEKLDFAQFQLQDFFIITNSGKYRLEFQMKAICFPSGWRGNHISTNVPILNFPSIEAQIEIKL